MATVLITTPASRHSRRGNRVTADRWAGLIRSLGHRVRVTNGQTSGSADVLVALHARKSSSIVNDYEREAPRIPIILAITGTDLYQDLPTSRKARRALDQADRIVVLQPDAVRFLPPSVRAKASAILQSAESPKQRMKRQASRFEVCVMGHLRSVKDPFRTALAARRLPLESTLQVLHLGTALTAAMRSRALREQERNSRYHWLGDRPRKKALQILARSRLMVLSSKVEGGANVISEALAADVPILASRISGSIGILGDDYPGLFEVGNTAELTELLWRSESDREFYRLLQARCRKLRPLVSPRRERLAWKKLLDEVLAGEP